MSDSVLDISRALIRLDTSNPGSTEELAAAYVSDLLAKRRLPFEVIEPAPGRCSVISRIRGTDPGLPPLVLHAHLDVVPAHDEGWTHNPFGGDIADGYLWGRGSVDMKVAAAMLLKLQLESQSERPPRRDIIVAYLADEEAGGACGSAWIVGNRPDLLEGAQEALGEIGGFNIDTANGKRLFLVQTAERGRLWIRIAFKGSGGHAALSLEGNPLTDAAALAVALADLEIPEAELEATQQLESGFTRALNGAPGEMSRSALGDSVGMLTQLLQQGRRTRFVPTAIAAGDSLNVVPSLAELSIDCRFLPGSRDAALSAIQALASTAAHIEALGESGGLESHLDSPMYQALCQTVSRLHPEASVLPFVMPAGSDAQHLARLGIACYGYTPLVLPPGFPYLDMFHAIDERLPLAAIEPGYRMLKELVLNY